LRSTRQMWHTDDIYLELNVPWGRELVLAGFYPKLC
jgi:hypothetical protein